MRRTLIALILAVLTGLTATAALAARSPQVKKPGDSYCLIARAVSSKSVFCRAVLVGLAAEASVGVNSNRLPYDEFGLAANQPSQPRIGGAAIPTTGPAVNGLGTQTSVTTDSNRLPYDEVGLAANQPSQPQVGSIGLGN